MLHVLYIQSNAHCHHTIYSPFRAFFEHLCILIGLKRGMVLYGWAFACEFIIRIDLKGGRHFLLLCCRRSLAG